MSPLEANANTTRYSSRNLLTGAGLAVLAGIMCGIEGWGENLTAGLAFLIAGIVLGVWALARRNTEADGETKAAWQRWVVAGVMLVHLIGAVSYCRKVPGADIDCYTFQQSAMQHLVHGTNPYGQTQTNLYNASETAKYYGPGMVKNGRVQVGLQYPPITLAWILPGYLLGDIRYSYIFAILLSAGLLFALSKGRVGFFLTLLLLLNPLTFLIENRCWTEPLVLAMLSLSVYAACRKQWWLPVALGLFLATKQYNFLALPFLQLMRTPFGGRAYWKLLGASLLVAMATVAPFAAWDSHALLHDLVLFHLAQPFRPDSLSFAVVWPRMTAVGPLLALAFAVWCIACRVRGPAFFAAAYGVALLLFVVTSKQAFCNYYFLAAHALLLGAGAMQAWRITQRSQCGSSLPNVSN